MDVKTFLSVINLKLREERPLVPDFLNHTVISNNDFVEIWFKTKGCMYSNIGSCTFCDYWDSSDFKADDMYLFVENALNSLESIPKTILLQASGSIFDLRQVSYVTLRKIFTRLRKYYNTGFLFETHLDSITEDIIKLCRKTLPNNKLGVEIGLESANPWTLKYSLNKSISLSLIEEKLNILKKYDIEPIANILVGAPFLSLSDLINDSVESIVWALRTGFNRCVLFPVNLKKWTLIYSLQKYKLYNLPSLWAFIEVLNLLPVEYLSAIEIVWFEKREQLNLSYKVNDIPPTTCNVCYSQIIDLLKQFRSDYDQRINILYDLNSVQCSCKDKFKAQLASEKNEEFNLFEIYHHLSVKILGVSWWDRNKNSIISDIMNYKSLSV